MTAHLWPLQTALYAALSAHPALAAELGDPPRVFDEAPAAAALPYIAFGETRSAAYLGCEGIFEHDVRLLVFSRHGGRKEVKRLLDAVVEALHGADLAVDGARLVSLRLVFADVFRRREGPLYEGVARFRALTETLPS